MRTIKTTELAHWFNAIRNITDHDTRTRMLDSLWDGQLESKSWLVDELEEYIMPGSSPNIYIFGGWTGILANMILQSPIINPKKVRSIDLDTWCESVADTVNKIHEMDDWRFKAVTGDMATYQYQSDIRPDIVINTSSEHITQECYNQWYGNIPRGTLVVVQGNNYFDCSEHVRCSTDIHDFTRKSLSINEYYIGAYPTIMYERYMAIWRKN
jgi:hypothetical protein